MAIDSGNIHRLTDAPLPGGVNEELVDGIREILEKAERGEITSGAWAVIMENGICMDGWAVAGGGLTTMAGGVSLLQVNYANNLLRQFCDD